MKRLLIFIMTIAVFSINAQNIILEVPNFPPLTEVKDGKVSGIAYDLVLKIVKTAGINVTYKGIHTYAVALQDLKSGVSDGFFSAAQTAERDEVAVRSKPMMTQHWIWVTLKASDLLPTSADFKSKAKAGVIMNTAQANFLTDNGYTISGNPVSGEQLIQMLISNRFNVALTNELLWDIKVKETKTDPALFTKYIERTTTDGIYISKQTIAKYPDIMDKINAAIDKVNKK
jgi:ABC-type amino acid transport substrate-binding protein